MATSVEKASSPIEGAIEIPRAKIRRFQSQPRKYFDQEELKNLANSILEEGQKTPVMVRRVTHPTYEYELIDGERRWLACGLIKREMMLAWVSEVSDPEDQFITSVLANMARVGHTPMEIAHAIERIKNGSRISRHSTVGQIPRIARMFGKSEPWVYQHLGLLRLHPDVQRRLGPELPEDQQISFSLAVFISSLPDRDLQLEVTNEVVRKGLKLNAARDYVRRIGEEVGILVGRGRKRRPDDDYRVLRSFLERTQGQARMFLQHDQTAITELFRSRPPEHRRATLDEIDTAIVNLNELRKRIARTTS